MTITDEMVRAALATYNRAINEFTDNHTDAPVSLDDIREVGLRAALTAALAAMWRPIEQYNGHQAILGWSLDGGRIVCFRDVAGQLHAQPGCVPLEQHIPTHFMPLPAPPATEVEIQKRPQKEGSR